MFSLSQIFCKIFPWVILTQFTKWIGDTMWLSQCQHNNNCSNFTSDTTSLHNLGQLHFYNKNGVLILLNEAILIKRKLVFHHWLPTTVPTLLWLCLGESTSFKYTHQLLLSLSIILRSSTDDVLSLSLSGYTEIEY